MTSLATATAVLVIPLVIPSQNAVLRAHAMWQLRARLTKETRMRWRSATTSAMSLLRLPRATGFRRVHIVSYRRQRCRDIANLIGGAKACVDGMVDAGLMVDDSDATARITYHQRVASESHNRKPCTVVYVTEQDQIDGIDP